MPRISTEEFERLPLRVHDFLAGVPLHDVWVVDLPQVRAGITLNEFLNSAREPLRCSLAVRVLVNVRFALGRVFVWDRKLGAQDLETFASRLTTSDRARTLTSPGKPEGIFRIVYRFENEQLLEIINRTAHAGALSALVERDGTYRFYFGVYVHPVGRFTRVYMALIDPLRTVAVYPSLLRSIQARWNETFRTG
ncbi:MAG TPA: DUF2867 domain-containing protein [Candidatus Sulfotelmatobacter sp.]|nr:DUF2867 domain-containing protein [Candidatus Sulfotelmatobacter sp.]